MAMQPVRSVEVAVERPLSSVLDDVVRSLAGVAAHSAELARIELQEGLRRSALAFALVLTGAVFLGIVAALLWGSLLWGLIWLSGDALGVPGAALLLWLLHAMAGLLAWRALRARLGRADEEPGA